MATLPRHHALHFYTLPYRYVSKLDNPLPARYHAKRHTTVTLLSRSQPNDANTPTPPNFAILNLCLTKYNVTFRYPYRALHNSELHCTALPSQNHHNITPLLYIATPCLAITGQNASRRCRYSMLLYDALTQHHSTLRNHAKPYCRMTEFCITLLSRFAAIARHDQTIRCSAVPSLYNSAHDQTMPLKNNTKQHNAIAVQYHARPNIAVALHDPT